jgi:transcriptional regulator with XRE-family HTH domain
VTRGAKPVSQASDSASAQWASSSITTSGACCTAKRVAIQSRPSRTPCGSGEVLPFPATKPTEKTSLGVEAHCSGPLRAVYRVRERLRVTFEPEQLGQSRTDLAEKLRELRKRADLTGDRLARRCNMSQSQISKFETGKKTPKLVDVERILRALDAPPEVVAEITALARIANTEWQDKRSSWRRGMEKRQSELAALESEATELRYFLSSMITGLLATPEYIRASLGHTPGDSSKTVARKLERQAVLYDTTKHFTFLLTEQAARWAIVPALDDQFQGVPVETRTRASKIVV